MQFVFVEGREEHVQPNALNDQLLDVSFTEMQYKISNTSQLFKLWTYATELQLRMWNTITTVGADCYDVVLVPV